MVDRLQTLVKSPYFHGDLSKKKAQSSLLKTKKTGTYLIRYSSRPGDFIVTVMNYKHRKADFDHHIVTVDKKNGHYILLIPPAGTTLNMALDMHRMAVLGGNPPSYPTFDGLISACKKTLGIAKASRFLPYKGPPPVIMPVETKAGKGTMLQKAGEERKASTSKDPKKKGK